MSGGRLRITLNEGKLTGLSAGEKYFVVLYMPDGCGAKPASFKTDPAKPDQFSTTNKMSLIDLGQNLDSSAQIRLALMESGLIKDKPVAEATFDCSELFQGQLHVHSPVTFTVPNGSCTVAIDIGWEGDPPAYIPRGGGGGGGAAAGAGTAGPAGSPAVGGGGAPSLVSNVNAATAASGPPLPNPEGRSFSVRLILRKAKNLQADDDHAEYDPLVSVTVGGETQKTAYQERTIEPYFDEELMFMVQKADANFWTMPIVVTVMSHNKIMADYEIGMTQLETQAVYRSPSHTMMHKWFLLRKSSGGTAVMGFLKMSIMVLDAMNDQIPELDDDPEDGDESEDAIMLNLVNTPGAQFEEIYLRSEIYRAQGLAQMDWNGKADPYVKLSYGMKHTKCGHLNETYTPEWNQALMLPIQKPALIDCLQVQLWDYDGIGRNKLIGTVRLSVDNMKAIKGELVGKNEEGLPRRYAQFINFYGCPRSFYKEAKIFAAVSKPKYYDDMDKGIKDGVDFRGRLLCRFVGSRDKECARDPIGLKPRVVVLQFCVVVQALQFSMLKKGTYTFRVSCGNGEDTPAASSKVPKDASDMRGTTSLGLMHLFFGEEVRLEQKLEVVLPPVAPDATPDQYKAFVYQQIPDIFVHLYREKDMYAVYRVKATDVVEKEDAVLFCDSMRVLSDPEKNSEGNAPTDPLGQFYVGMFVRRVDPHASSPEPLEEAEVKMIPVGNDVRFKGISLGDPEKFLLEACIHRGDDFPCADSNGLSDPYIRVCWANSSSQTGVQLETLNPTFEELVLVRADARQPFTNIIVELWDWDLIGSNNFLAKAVVNSFYAGAGGGTKMWLNNFFDNRGKKLDTKLLVSFEIKKDVGQKYADKAFTKGPRSKDTYTGFDIPQEKKLQLSKRKVTLTALALRKMRAFRMLDVKHAQVTVSIGNATVDFDKKKGLNPDIGQTKTIVMDLPKEPQFWPSLSVSVIDHRALGSKPRIGSANLALTTVVKEEGNRTVNRFDSRIKEEENRAADRNLTLKLDALTRWKHEAFGDPTLIAAASYADPASPMSAGGVSGAYSPPMNEESFALSQSEKKKRDEQRKERAARRKAKRNEDGDDEAQEMEDSATEQPEHEAALQRVKDEQEKLFTDDTDRELAKLAKEAAVISQPSDIPWFERFDADASIEQKDFIVSRLGKAYNYLAKKEGGLKIGTLVVKEPTAEEFFGPFAEGQQIISLTRGKGKNMYRAGELRMDITIDDATEADLLAVAKPAEKKEGAGPKQDRKDRSKEQCFELRAYLISCRNLAAVDHSMFGSSSDPFLVLTMGTGEEGGGDKSQQVKMNLRDFRKEKTLNPDYYLVQQLSGKLPRHSNLQIQVFDYNDILSDVLIGTTNINLEDRWYSTRGYGCSLAHFEPGSYTEKRFLRDDNGQVVGTIELWIDMFATGSKIPRPIDINPPPPIEMELRAIIWCTRDVMLEDTSLSGEPMVDIYVRAWMNGLRHDMQSTDVHYRSLDGSGTFNWRMNFPFLFDPRSRKIMARGKKAKSIANWVRIRREQKKFDPVLKVQIFDNSILPGSDNFIGEASLNLLKLRPAVATRLKVGLVSEILKDVTQVATTFLCCSCCKHDPSFKELSLEDRQRIAKEEFQRDVAAKEKMFNDEVDERMKCLMTLKQNDKPLYDSVQLAAFRAKFMAEARAKSQVNAFEAYLPSGRKKDVSKHLKSVQELPAVSETAKYWFTARGPKGACRVGDVQISFQLVRIEAMEKDEKLVAGRGRSDPQALPDPNRPDTSYFWLTSPFKAATHIMWTRYKWYILGLIALVLLGLFIYVFLTTGVQAEANKFFT